MSNPTKNERIRKVLENDVRELNSAILSGKISDSLGNITKRATVQSRHNAPSSSTSISRHYGVYHSSSQKPSSPPKSHQRRLHNDFGHDDPDRASSAIQPHNNRYSTPINVLPYVQKSSMQKDSLDEFMRPKKSPSPPKEPDHHASVIPIPQYRGRAKNKFNIDALTPKNTSGTGKPKKKTTTKKKTVPKKRTSKAKC